MITIKSEAEIAKMRQGGKLLASILEKVKSQVKPGITTLELDRYADKLISQVGEPSFKKVRDYQWATCMCVNEVVVHGIPDNYKLKEGDILGIDIGIFYQGFHTDMSWTLRVQTQNSKLIPQSGSSDFQSRQTQNDKIEKFLRTGEEALKKAIAVAKAGNRVGHISKVIQETIEAGGYSAVRALVGHGIGRQLHEDPAIPCFLKAKIETTPALKEGMVLAIEVIYNQGKPGVVYKNDDGWTIQTADGSLSGLFEQTIAILGNRPIVLTKSN